MAIIHTNIPKRKARKPTAKQRELQASWEAMLKKYETKRPIAKSTKAYTAPKPFIRAMIGISTLHKSNAVPVFSQEDAKEHSRMRRG